MRKHLWNVAYVYFVGGSIAVWYVVQVAIDRETAKNGADFIEKIARYVGPL